MVPARKNDRNWLPGIFNEFFGNEWLERSRSAVPAVNITYLRREFSYSRFQQTLLLPDNVEKEKITAKVENGVMTIEIPKMKEAEKAAESRRIEVM